MFVKILKEEGLNQALLGLSLSYNINFPEDLNKDEGDSYNRIKSLSYKLAIKDGGHNKFLESVMVWLDIRAPRYWWSQFDTYRTGTTKQSESTMHTLLKFPLTQASFESPLPAETLDYLENLRKNKDLTTLKRQLPEGFLQRRIVCTNYKTLRNIFRQRKGHKLNEWNIFIFTLLYKLREPDYFRDIMVLEKEDKIAFFRNNVPE